MESIFSCLYIYIIIREFISTIKYNLSPFDSFELNIVVS